MNVFSDSIWRGLWHNNLYQCPPLSASRKESQLVSTAQFFNFIAHQGFRITAALSLLYCKMRRFILKTFKWSVSILHSNRITVLWSAPCSFHFTITHCNLSSQQIPLPYFPDISLRGENIESRISCNWPAICHIAWKWIHMQKKKRKNMKKIWPAISYHENQETSTSLDPTLFGKIVCILI